MDFKGPGDPLGIGGGESGGGHWVNRSESLVHRRPPELPGLLGHFQSDLFVGRRDLINAMTQRLEIEHGAANHQGPLAPGMNRFKCSVAVAKEGGHRVAVFGVAEVNEVVWHPSPIIRTGLGRSNVEATIDQGRIHIDDFAGPQEAGLCQGLGQTRLPAGGWPDDAERAAGDAA